MPLLFSYGTLQQENVQLSIFGRRLQGTPHHAIVTFTGRNDSRVKGTVFEVSEEELASADRYEPAGYKRISTTLASGKVAWVYADARS